MSRDIAEIFARLISLDDIARVLRELLAGKLSKRDRAAAESLLARAEAEIARRS